MSLSHSTQFYRQLPVLASFEEATETSRHERLPDDWFVVITDVIGSTQAIEAGRYKDVNSVGGATIVAVLNVDRTIAVPFVFGGDGATLAVPQQMLEGVSCALLGAKAMAKESFGLELRTGIVPVRDLVAQNFYCGIARWRQSAHVVQAAVSGRGWEVAERWVKGPETRGTYEITATAGRVAAADFSGFECRWQSVKSRNGCQVSLLAIAMAVDSSERTQCYADVMAKIYETLGSDIKRFHPLALDTMKLAVDPRQLRGEVRVRTQNKNWVQRFLYGLQIWLRSRVGSFLFKKGIDTKSIRWSRYKADMIANTDFRKFDGMLRMVLDCSIEQADDLERYLQRESRGQRICFGMHRSTAALVTCMVYSYDGDHTHFVDGADGGYALAAKRLKAQLREYVAK